MDFKKLSRKIDEAFKNENVFVMIEGVKNNKGYFIAQGRSKEELSMNMINYRLKNSLNGMDLFLTIL